MTAGTGMPVVAQWLQKHGLSKDIMGRGGYGGLGGSAKKAPVPAAGQDEREVRMYIPDRVAGHARVG
jgi:hypothetical protein